MAEASTLDSRAPKARAPRGFADRRGAALLNERRILEAVIEVYERYGFEPLETGALEYADALGKFLPDADRPNDGVFALRDDDEQWLALRYDLTAPLARFVAEHRADLPRPYRRWAFGPVWRNEKPGPGHGRQFTQCDADTVGSARAEADAEIIAMALEACAAAGLGPDGARMRINSRRLLDGALATAGVADEKARLAALRAADKLDRLGAAAVADLLGPGRRDESGAFTAGAGLPVKAIDAVMAFVAAGRPTRDATLEAMAAVVGGSAAGEAGLEELGRIGAALTALGVEDAAAAFDPSVVRGLEYYTGAVFEAQLLGDDELARRFGSICGGGRYDDLVARFTGERVPATGFSLGVSRLVEALAARATASPAGRRRGPVVVLALDPTRMADTLAMVGDLRRAGIAAEPYLGESGMRAQLKYADRRGSPAAVIVGESEFAAGQATVKDLDLGRALAAEVADNRAWREERPGQRTVARADLVAAVLEIVGQRRR